MNKKIGITIALMLTVFASQSLVFANTHKVQGAPVEKTENLKIEHTGLKVNKSCCAADTQCMKIFKRKDQTTEKTIVDIAAGDDRFKTLVAALNAAELVDTLKGNGPFTVFAPTDEAFAKLPPGTLDQLLKPENKEKLANILTYHVVPGRVTAEDALKLGGQEVSMVNEDKAKIEVRNGTVFIDGARVIATDIMAKNGIIHVIDTVMMPPND